MKKNGCYSLLFYGLLILCILCCESVVRMILFKMSIGLEQQVEGLMGIVVTDSQGRELCNELGIEYTSTGSPVKLNLVSTITMQCSV